MAYTVSFTELNNSTTSGASSSMSSVSSVVVSSCCRPAPSTVSTVPFSVFVFDSSSAVGSSAFSCTVCTISVETVFSVLSSAAVVSLEQPNMEAAKHKTNAATTMLVGVSFFFKVDSSSFCLFVSIAQFPVVDKGGIHYRDGAAARHGWGLGGCE